MQDMQPIGLACRWRLPKLAPRRKKATEPVLNRLFIIIGLLAILALGAAFVVPRFIQWGDYRERMQALASEVLGTEVRITGDIGFTLLPQPQMRFSNVAVGPIEAPILTVGSVEADFSLLDFLRDRYVVTRLLLSQPMLDLAIDDQGRFNSPLRLAERVTTSNISVANASVVDGGISIFDVRGDRRVAAGDVDGELRLEALRGPFTFQGSASYEQNRYGVRISTAAMDPQGRMQVSTFIRSESIGFSIAAEGELATGESPRFAGNLSYRQVPPAAGSAETVQGDLVLTSPVEATPERITLSAYVLQPDENRAATRMQGAATIHLGERYAFDATLSSAVVALPARDATQDQSGEPYEIVRLLQELPPPPMPFLPGTIKVDIAELNLRAFSVRDLVAEAVASGQTWTLSRLEGRLPGDTRLQVEGMLSGNGGRPLFDGQVSLATERLDAFSLIWREPSENNVLFNMPGSVDAKLALTGDTLRLSEGIFVLGGTSHVVSAEMTFGDQRAVEFRAKFNDLDATRSAALADLLPDTQDAGFAVTFPHGRFSVEAGRAVVYGLEAEGLAADGGWSEGTVRFERLVARELGGTGFDLTAQFSGTLAAPVVSGSGSVRIRSGAAPALALALDGAGAPPSLRPWLAASMPASLNIALAAPDADGRQGLSATGRIGAADLDLQASFDAGLPAWSSAPLTLDATLASRDPASLARQLGLGDAQLLPASSPASVKFDAEGSLAEGFRTDIAATGGSDMLAYAGSLAFDREARPGGSGKLSAKLSAGDGLAALLGAPDLPLPAFEGGATLQFAGDGSLTLSALRGAAGGHNFTGDLAVTRDPQGKRTVAGTLMLDPLEIGALAAALAGSGSLQGGGDGLWPSAPFGFAREPRDTGGRITVQSPSLLVQGRNLGVDDLRFDYVWTDTETRIRGLEAAAGGGRLQLDLGLCCTGPIPDKQLTGRLSLDRVSLETLLPPGAAASLRGVLSGSVRIDGTGSSIADIVGGLTGDGSFALGDFAIEHLDPRAFETVAGLDNILTLEPDDLGSIVAVALDQGAFQAPELSGVFTIAGGTVRAENLAAENAGARLFGGGSISLADLGLEGSFTLTPTSVDDPQGLINETTSLITAVLSGTLAEPQRRLDLGTMVDAIKVRAYELEVERLEQLRAQEEARARAAAEERARLMEEQARRLAEEAARRAAEEEQRRAAEAARLAAEQRAADDAAAAAQDPQSDPQADPTAPAGDNVPPPGAPPLDGPLNLQLPSPGNSLLTPVN